MQLAASASKRCYDPPQTFRRDEKTNDEKKASRRGRETTTTTRESCTGALASKVSEFIRDFSFRSRYTITCAPSGRWPLKLGWKNDAVIDRKLKECMHKEERRRLKKKTDEEEKTTRRPHEKQGNERKSETRQFRVRGQDARGSTVPLPRYERLQSGDKRG